jgi:hypothetical protein
MQYHDRDNGITVVIATVTFSSSSVSSCPPLPGEANRDPPKAFKLLILVDPSDSEA